MQSHGRSSSSSSKRVAALQYLLNLVLLCTTSSPAAGSKPLLVTDADMGIHTYSSIVLFNKQPATIRTQLRFMCGQQPNGRQEDSSSSSSSTVTDSMQHTSTGETNDGQATILVEGFVSSFPISTQPPEWSPARCHYAALNVRHLVNISITSRSGSTPFAWVGPRDYGLWHMRAQLSGPGPYQLSVLGSDTVHDLPHPLCPQQQQQQPGSPDLAGGIWNVLTTTSAQSMNMSMLAWLLTEHNTYHRSLGLSGTILRSNIDESRELIQLPDVQEAIQNQGLIIWPWEHEHVSSFSTHFWQKPKHQHTLLGFYGRNARLAFFDLDEYLVLPGSSNSITDTQCFGKPLLDMGEDRRNGSWVFVRYQTRSCLDADADIACWQQGRSPMNTSDIPILQDLCPMSEGHGKHILVPDMVDTISVHFAWSEHFNVNVVVNATCGYLLHFYALLGDRRPPITRGLQKFPPQGWNINPKTRRREVQWPEGLEPYVYSCHALKNARMDALERYKAVQSRLAGGQHSNVAMAA